MGVQRSAVALKMAADDIPERVVAVFRCEGKADLPGMASHESGGGAAKKSSQLRQIHWDTLDEVHSLL